MIYFHQNLAKKAIKAIEETHELLEIKSGIADIDATIGKIRNCMSYENLQAAQNLDRTLRKKYSTIALMLEVADKMAPLSLNVGYAQQNEIPEITKLTQDRCGILCHTLLKKGIIGKTEDFIEKVV